MDFYTILTLIISVSAAFAYVNYRYIKLPATIGIMILSLVSSIVLVFVGRYYPDFSDFVIRLVSSIDFHDLLMDIMLSFLLFAGAIHIDATSLKQERWPIMSLATVGTLISTLIVGGLLYFLFILFGQSIDFIYCLLFGALISPTDPIAVLGILKKANIPRSLEHKISGESLFNDGIAVVIFITIMEIAEAGLDSMSVVDIILLFLKEAGGGLLYGLGLGYVGFWLLRSIDNYKVEVLITLAIVMGGYAFAQMMHISGPLAMVVAGIITGNKGKEFAMSDVTRDYLGKFWELIDEILNAILFLLIGFEMLVIHTDNTIMLISVISIFIILLARFISVFIPISILKFKIDMEKNAVIMLTWGGLRGGISVALALSLPQNMFRDEFVAITYIIVIFSIIVQGLTVGKVAKKLM